MERIVEIFLPIYINNEKTNYLISDNGTVKNFVTNKILKASPNDNRYFRINIVHNNKIYTKRIHILIAKAFIPNPENKPTVNHKDGDKSHNYYENLEWATYQENTQHAFDTGLNKGPRGILNAKSIYNESQIIKVCELLQYNNLSIKEISLLTYVAPLTIRHLLKNIRWKHITCNYDFLKYDKLYAKKCDESKVQRLSLG